MKLRIKTDATGDPLLRKLAAELGFTPEQLAEVAVYYFLASYLADRDGPDAANEFLQANIPGHGEVGDRLGDTVASSLATDGGPVHHAGDVYGGKPADDSSTTNRTNLL